MRLLPGALVAFALTAVLGDAAYADPFFFTTGNPDGRLGVASRPESADGSKTEIEAADDFTLHRQTLLYGAIFTGLMPANFDLPDIGQVNVEIYRVFPKDSDPTRTPNVPTRTNSPADVQFNGEFALKVGKRSTADGGLRFAFVVTQIPFQVSNSVINGINPLPNQHTGGEGPVSGWLTQFTVIFTTEFILPPGHYFIVPQIEVLHGLGEFLWVSAGQPQVTGDLQMWVRNENLEPDWLRVGSDIVGDTTFNASFSLFGENLPPARQSSTIALSDDDSTLVNVNPEANTVSVFAVTPFEPTIKKVSDIPVGNDPASVAIHPSGAKAYVANSLDGTVSVVDLINYKVINTLAVGAEPVAVALSPSGTRLYVANSASNTLQVLDTTGATETVLATVDLSPFGTAPRAIGVTNTGLTDLDQTIFVALFFGQLRPGKTFLQEGQDDQREGRVVAISAATNQPLGAPNPITLSPVADTGFNANGRLAGQPGQVPDVPSTNPQTFTTPTGAFPNQLAAVAMHPYLPFAYVASTGASPNGPFRFNVNSQGLVSVFDMGSRLEVTSAQVGTDVRREAPLNINKGVNLATTPAPTFFFSNPVAMTWRSDGSDAWIAIQNSDLLVRMTIDGNGIPSVNAPLAAGPSAIVRVDLQAVDAGQIAGKAPRGIAINSGGTLAYVFNFISRSVSVVDISYDTAPSIVATAQASALPEAGSADAIAHLGAEFFYTGRGRMSNASWGGCIVCHPNGRSDNVTWMFDAGPRQTVPLDGMFNKSNPADQRALNWSAVRDENQDFELNTRGVFGGQGLIDDDRLFFAISGAMGSGGRARVPPRNRIRPQVDLALFEQFQQATGAVSTTNDLAGGAALPPLPDGRRDFAIATLPDARVYVIGGRTGTGLGTLVSGGNTVLEFNPRTNALTLRSSAGFTARHSLGAAAVKTSGGFRIYAIGGYASTSGSAPPVPNVEEYDPAMDTWRTVASLPTAVAQFGITVAGGINTAEPLQLIHVVSGNSSSETSPSVANANPIQRFQADPTGSGTWSVFSPAGLTLRRNLGAATALRGVTSRVFVIGGQDAAGNVLTTVEEYLAQAVTLVASPPTPLPAPRAQFGIGSTLTSNQIYVMGGVDNTGADQATVLEFTVPTNGPLAGPPGTPSGAWVTRANLSVARHGLGVSTPPGVTNFLPVQSTGRDPRQDAMAVFVARNVRSSRAPVSANDALAAQGRELFGQVGLVVAGFSCATCHGGPKWTRSMVDYTPPPSPEVGLGLGNERVIGAELRQTATQGPNPGQQPGVLIDVGTFTLGGGRLNEIRPNPADISHAIAPLGANGFNIPSLLSVHETGPYFYSGLAQTLEEVLNGSLDTNGGVQHHFVTDAGQRAALIAFLRSIDQTTPTFP